MKVEKICIKRYLEILIVAFIALQFLLMIRLYFLGLPRSSVYQFEHVISIGNHVMARTIRD
jgi:hypothetical protein